MMWVGYYYIWLLYIILHQRLPSGSELVICIPNIEPIKMSSGNWLLLLCYIQHKSPPKLHLFIVTLDCYFSSFLFIVACYCFFLFFVIFFSVTFGDSFFPVTSQPSADANSSKQVKATLSKIAMIRSTITVSCQLAIHSKNTIPGNITGAQAAEPSRSCNNVMACQSA